MSRTSLQYTARGCSTIQDCFIKVLVWGSGDFGFLWRFVFGVCFFFFFPRKAKGE